MSLDTDVQVELDGPKCPSCGDGLDNCKGVDGEECYYYVCQGCGCKFYEDGTEVEK